MVISIVVDLQDDINVFVVMIEHYYNGSDIVYVVRNNRDTDGWFKRNSAIIFYKLIGILAVGFAIDGITFFSIKPIRLIINIGFILSFFSFLYLIYVIVGKLLDFDYVTDWASIIAFICFLGVFKFYVLVL